MFFKEKKEDHPTLLLGLTLNAVTIYQVRTPLSFPSPAATDPTPCSGSHSSPYFCLLGGGQHSIAALRLSLVTSFKGDISGGRLKGQGIYKLRSPKNPGPNNLILTNAIQSSLRLLHTLRHLSCTHPGMVAHHSSIELSEQGTALNANNAPLTNKRNNHGTLEIQLLASVTLPHSLRHDSGDWCTAEWPQTLIMVHYKPCMPDLCTAISRGVLDRRAGPGFFCILKAADKWYSQ